MQPDHDPSEEWQQPAEAQSQAPFQAPQEPEVQDVQDPGQTDNNSEQLADDQPDIEEDSATIEDDTALIRWQAPEHTSHDKSSSWYVIFAIVTLVLVLIAIFLIHSVTFAILVPVMAVALFIYTRRPPELLQYTLSRKGLHINDRLYPYGLFKSFGVISHADMHSAVLVPRKRFQIGQTVYFPENVGEQIVDMLASRLPMQEIEPDAIDRLLARLHL